MHLHRLSIVTCVVWLVVSLAIIAAKLPINAFVVVLMGWQCAVYFFLIAYAWICRENFAALVVLNLVTLIAVGLGLLMIGAAQPDPGLAIGHVMARAIAQLVAANVGGAIAYALAARTILDRGSNSASGMVVVISLIPAPPIFACVAYRLVGRWLLA
jgi:hypothetical protein